MKLILKQAAPLLHQFDRSVVKLQVWEDSLGLRHENNRNMVTLHVWEDALQPLCRKTISLYGAPRMRYQNCLNVINI